MNVLRCGHEMDEDTSSASSASARSLVDVAMPHCRGKWLSTSATLRLNDKVMVKSSQQGIVRMPTFWQYTRPRAYPVLSIITLDCFAPER